MKYMLRRQTQIRRRPCMDWMTYMLSEDLDYATFPSLALDIQGFWCVI